MDPLCVFQSSAWGAIWPDLIKGLPAAVVALVVAAIAASIALRQYQVAKAKLNLDLFDKRYEVYLTVQQQAAWPSLHSALPTREADALIVKSGFLFSLKTRAVVEGVVLMRRGLDRLTADIEAGRFPDGEAGDVHAQQAELIRILDMNYKTLQTHFGEYMDFSKWRG